MSGSADISACWAQVAARWAPRLEGLDIRRELDVLDRLGGSLILPGEPWWPPGLDQLEHPPFCLWVRGDPSLLVNAGDLRDKGLEDAEPGAVGDDGAPRVAGAGQPVREQRMPVGPASGLCLALVGARASTRYGETVVTSLASGVTAKGGLIVSGGAFGIDACAHRGALGEGPTVSVSAGGVDRLYPVANTEVLEAVARTWNPASIRSFIANRDVAPARNLSDPALGLVANSPLDTTLVAVKSDYFIADGIIRYDRVESETQTLLKRLDTGGVLVIWRHSN